MTQTAYTSAIMNALLGWLKGLANWVLKLFDLADGGSPLKFLADNWLKLLIIFLIVGVLIDLLVWLVRWRPHWVWFRKKRVIINDANFFADEDACDENGLPIKKPTRERPARPRRNWEDREYIVPNAQRVKREQQRAREQAARERRRLEEQQSSTDVFTDGMFNVNAKQRFSDRYEDEVFSVSDLPTSAGTQQRRAPGQRGRTENARNTPVKAASPARNRRVNDAHRRDRNR